MPNAAGRDATASPSISPPEGHAPRPRAAFSRDRRLLRKSDFDAVYRQGRRRTSAQFAVFCRRNALDRSRFGMSVKRALGSAVVRNRIRRRIREILRVHVKEIAPGWDIVLQPRVSVARANFTALTAELIELLRRALTPPAASHRSA